MPTTFTVRIVKRGNVKCTVVPPHCPLEPLDKIVFKAPEVADVVVLIPDDIFTVSNRVIDVPKGTTSSANEIKAGTAKGVYVYTVYCSKHEDFAEGNSPPTMIVE